MKMKSALLAAGFMIGAPALAQAGWYVGADGGFNFLQNQHTDISSGGVATGSSKTDSKTGYALAVQGGYDFGGPKAELELAYRRNNVKSILDSDPPYQPVPGAGGSTSSFSVMANGIYQFLPQSSIHPFIGAGIGAARVSGKWHDSDPIISDAQWRFAYQGIAGVAYDINANLGVKAQYRYFATVDPKFTTVDGSDRIDSEFKSHSILVGLTYKFGN